MSVTVYAQRPAAYITARTRDAYTYFSLTALVEFKHLHGGTADRYETPHHTSRPNNARLLTHPMRKRSIISTPTCTSHPLRRQRSIRSLSGTAVASYWKALCREQAHTLAVSWGPYSRQSSAGGVFA